MTTKRPSRPITRPDLPVAKKKKSGEVETKRPPPPRRSRSKRPRAIDEELAVDFSKDPRRED